MTPMERLESIATTALGMGVDIKGLHWIINYGPPSDIESYVQELGRAGRDGKQSEALPWQAASSLYT